MNFSFSKSTLTDRFLQVTGAVPEEILRDRAQFLDSNPVERDRKITIKARAARMTWNDHILNLIDCPGYVIQYTTALTTFAQKHFYQFAET